MEIPRSVLHRAAQCHGLLRLDQLLVAGLNRGAIDRFLAGGRLHGVRRGVYRLAGAPETWEQRLLAACWATGGVASHRAAARLWKVDLDTPTPVEVTVARGHAPRPCGVVVHRSRDLVGASVPHRQNIPVTTPLRMLVDLGAVTGHYGVARALGACVVAGLVSVAGARAELDRLSKRGRPGIGTLRRVLVDWPLDTQQPDSVLEVAFARLVHEHRLPPPVFQHQVIVGGRRRRIDFAYPALMLAVEVDGFGPHAAERVVYQDDHWRQNDLVVAGWHVLRFTWQDVLYRQDYVARTITTELGKLAAA